MSQYETVDRIRRSHRAARPNPAANPAWANCHMDCGILLAEIDRLRATLKRLDADYGLPNGLGGLSKIVREALSAESMGHKKCPDCGRAYGDLARCACGRLPDNQSSEPT